MTSQKSKLTKEEQDELVNRTKAVVLRLGIRSTSVIDAIRSAKIHILSTEQWWMSYVPDLEDLRLQWRRNPGDNVPIFTKNNGTTRFRECHTRAREALDYMRRSMVLDDLAEV